MDCCYRIFLHFWICVPPRRFFGLSLGRVGTVFSVSQLLQCTAVLATPLLYRRLGTIKGFSLAQTMTAVFLLLMCSTRMVPLSIVYFLAFNGAQWMCGQASIEA